MSKKVSSNENVNVKDVQEVIELISKLDEEQKKIALAALRGAVLIAETESEKKGA